VLVAIGGVAIAFSDELAHGTLEAMGPGMFPRTLGVLAVVCGIILVMSLAVWPSDAIDPIALKGPLLVLIAITVFAVTIRPLILGPVRLPSLGLVIAGPLVVIISGYASSRARLTTLLISAFAQTAFCIVLFNDVLGLPIPIYPSVIDTLLTGPSPRSIARLLAAALAAAAILLMLLRPKVASNASSDDGVRHG
jgi:hypothetical protein